MLPPTSVTRFGAYNDHQQRAQKYVRSSNADLADATDLLSRQMPLTEVHAICIAVKKRLAYTQDLKFVERIDRAFENTELTIDDDMFQAVMDAYTRIRHGRPGMFD